MRPIAVYASMNAFYDDRGGRASGETDSGIHNINDLDWDHTERSENSGRVRFIPVVSPRVRVSTVKETGDTYAICEAVGSPTVALLGRLTLPQSDDAYPAITRAFRGYADGPGLGKPLSWFVQRIEQLAQSGMTQRPR